MKEELEKNINDLIHKNNYIKINDQIYLKQYQKDILDYYHIDYYNCSSISEILFLILELLESDEDGLDDLEEVALSLQEFQYYHNTNK